MRIALVTGASSGLGRETAVELADRFGGLTEIWAVARREERLRELEKEVPVRLRMFPLDITNPKDLEILQRELEREKPEIRMLVNAAGCGKMGPVEGHSLEEEAGMVALNCQALVSVTRMALPYLRPNSRILQFASGAGFCPQPGFATYAATKAFVRSYSRALGEELRGRNISVTAVCPGPVRTEFLEIAGDAGQIPVYKALMAARPEKVVKKALRDSLMGRPESVYGIWMKLFSLFGRLVPEQLIFKAMNLFK